MDIDQSKKDEANANESDSWWGWSSSWIQSAKEKSSTALEFMKRDLSEFSQVVQTDAVAAVSSTAALLKEKLTVDNAEAVADKARQSITSVIGTIADVFVPQKELEDTELMIIKNSEPVVMDWWQSRLYLIQKDPKTFCHEPEGPPEMYENWLESFDPGKHQEEMTEIMMSCSEVRNYYDKLVPTSVSHLEFWQRYFYRVHILKKADVKRAELLRRAEQITIDNVGWTEDNVTAETEDHKPSSKRKPSTENSLSFEGNSSHHTPRLSDSEKVQTQPVSASETTSTQNSKTDQQVTVTNDKLGNVLNPMSSKPDSSKPDNSNESNISSDIPSEPSSADSTDGSCSSPIESLGKDYSTGDEWEKDFDVDINEIDLKHLNSTSAQESNKEEEDDWEKWQ